MHKTRLLLAALFVAAALPAFAQTGGETASAAAGARPPERIVRPMRAVDPMTLKAEGVNIRLWGIKPARTSETPLEIRALDLMDRLIYEQQVNCKIVGGRLPDLVGRCTTQDNADIALSLLGEGYAVVDRKQTYNSVFATSYEEVQEQARLKSRGVWRYVNENDAPPVVPAWLRPHMETLLPLALLFGPFAGLLVVAAALYFGLRRVARGGVSEDADRKEAGLQARERRILVSTLQGEVAENKNKIEAFLAIYGDMLRGLREGKETPKYQQAGDIVQKHPAFSRAVFEANAGSLSLLDMKLAGMVSKLYAAVPSGQEYINLEPHVPLDTAVQLLEKVLKDAESLLPQVDAVLAELAAAEEEAG